jgi:hydrogenase maturation protein HypF
LPRTDAAAKTWRESNLAAPGEPLHASRAGAQQQSWQIRVSGQVQGVGFRPFVYRLAQRLNLCGAVQNRSSGVHILARGEPDCLESFVSQLRQDAPGRIRQLLIESRDSVPTGGGPDGLEGEGFTIRASRADAGIADVLLADRALCGQCVEEFNDPANRRHAYPFISCTDCGPRYSVCRSLPWDRANTAWDDFPLCERCLAEYHNPEDRRFHAVGISCPDCGPGFLTANGSRGDRALSEAVAIIEQGGILAVKGVSGFQLMVDANNAAAVARLKRRKRRHKPLAVLAPDLHWVQQLAGPDECESEALCSPQAPIVLLAHRGDLVQRLGPGTDLLGVMLPNSGIQLALMSRLRRPLVATSGNVSGSPLVFTNEQARQELAEVADGLLMHDLQLTQGLDDPVVRVMAGKTVTLRLGRGLAPLLMEAPADTQSMGCGAHLKASVALQQGQTLVGGPYVGDLVSAATRRRYREQKRWLPKLFQTQLRQEITDLHPDYASTIDADYRAPAVPHHLAHAMAAWLEHRPLTPFLALTWDGTGLGPDGAIWGGECLRIDTDWQWQRCGSLRRFRLPPADDIARYPGRIASILKGGETGGKNLEPALECSSMGRLLEAAAALAGLRAVNDYEAQAAMEWEALAWRGREAAPMSMPLCGTDLDWRPLLPALQDASSSLADRALGFHRALARAAVQQCLACRRDDKEVVLLSGGVFQNRLLVELMLQEGESVGLTILPPARIPPNDGGIALGQCAAFALGLEQREGIT